MSNFLDPVKSAIRQAVAEADRKTESRRIIQAFRNGIAVGIAVGASLVFVVWAFAILSR